MGRTRYGSLGSILGNGKRVQVSRFCNVAMIVLVTGSNFFTIAKNVFVKHQKNCTKMPKLQHKEEFKISSRWYHHKPLGQSAKRMKQIRRM
jgi:hypothetical protein